MPNANFDGDFRQRPQQNFAGANRNLHREQLIERAALERRQREEIRKHTQFAIQFQSQIRRYLSRKRSFEIIRKEFDELASELKHYTSVSENVLTYLVKRIAVFYSFSKDVDRLFLIDTLLIKNKDTVIKHKANCERQWKFWLKSIFRFNSNLFVAPRNNYSTKLMNNLELIIELYRDYLKPQQLLNDELNSHLWHHLITNSYYHNLRIFIDTFYKENFFALPLSKLIYENLIICPLSNDNLNPEYASLFVHNFLNEFLSGPLTESIKNYILPQISNSLPINLNAKNILESFDLNQNSQNPYSFLWIFYSTIKLLATQIYQLNDEQIKKYLTIIRAFSLNLSFHIKSQVNFSFNLEENEDDKDLENEQLLEFVEEIFATLNDANHCNIIVKFMDNIINKDKNSLISLSYLCHSMLLFHPFAIHKNRLLHSLAFNTNFLRDLWCFVSTEKTVSLFDSATVYLHLLSSGVQSTSVDWQSFLPPLTLFCALFNYFLQTLDDVEFFNEYFNEIDCNFNLSYNYSVLPFKLNELVSMSSVLRDICISLIELAYQDRKINFKPQLFGSPQDSTFHDHYNIQCWNLLLKSSLKLLRNIYARDIRRKFCPESHWISKKSFACVLPANFNFAIQQRGQLYQEFRGIRHLGRDEMDLYGSPIPVKDIVNVTVIQELPFVVAFHERVKIMQSLISYEKRLNERDFYEFLSHGYAISIRRNYIYEDSFEKLSADNLPNLKKMIRIQLVSALGLEETGIDGGGVFREFLSEAIKTAFDPNRGFFKVTSDSLLYPNPSIHLLVENSNKHYFFIGRLLGKAIYENMLTELPLAPFFMAKLLTKNINSDVEINHLASLDPVLYKNLISLKNYKGDVSELGLDFSTMTCELGTNLIEELKPNGTNIAVTNQNRIEYIHLMADYKLNKQIRNQCAAFKEGFYNVVNLDWIKMFDTRELQILISGAHTPIDLNDLMQHTVYSGGYQKDHPVIKMFWDVVSNFDESDKRKLLKFITSCSRPPLLGFKDLYPALCIQNAGRDPERLPTSSTCMNLLKLPEVQNKQLMKDKLIYSINSGSGFELS